jgi:dihydroneopterin aldolase
MMGTIGFEDLAISCIIGCCPEERVKEREILVDLEVELSLAKPAKSDRIEDAMSYVDLATLCTDIAKTKKFHLIEAYATHVVEAILTHYPVVEKAYIKVKKPHAFPGVKWSSVMLSKERK